MNKPRYAFLEPGRYARGWHIVLFSSELQIGEVKQLHYFDRDIVAYRGESGRVAILDAHCPHLGANLASGEGRVSGDTIACPFHGWVFDPDGRCVDIPYAKKIPDNAVNALKGWPVQEKNGFIALWYDPESGEPEDYLPEIEEWGPTKWGLCLHGTTKRITSMETTSSICTRSSPISPEGFRKMSREKTTASCTTTM